MIISLNNSFVMTKGPLVIKCLLWYENSHIWSHKFNNFFNVLEQLCIWELEENFDGEDDA
jgi:hypothetical protein